MKTAITTLQGALAYQLQGLSYAEKKVQKEFNACSHHLTSVKLKTEIDKYIDSSDSKLLKLERIFNYLMQEPTKRKNQVIDKLLDETHEMLSYTSSPHLKDILMISCIQNICAYKISGYKTASMFSVELELDTVTDLIRHILEWETQTSKTLAILALEEFDRTQRVDIQGTKGS